MKEQAHSAAMNYGERAYAVIQITIPGFSGYRTDDLYTRFSDLEGETRFVFEGRDWTRLLMGLITLQTQTEALIADVREKMKESNESESRR